MKTCIHIGSESIDQHTHTQAQTDAVIAAIVASIPNTDYIAIGTYLDYPADVSKWATSIHAVGKKMWYRSNGWNTWQGTNGASATGTPTQHRADTFTTANTNWIRVNKAVFTTGDIFEVIPDESVDPSAAYYIRTYGASGVGTSAPSRSDYNTFVTGAITDCNATMVTESITGVSTDVLFDVPSVMRIANPANSAVDIITTTTAGSLGAFGADHYPETATTADPHIMQAQHTGEINFWVNGMGVSNTQHYTFGSNVNLQLEKGNQAEAFRTTMFAIQRNVTSIDGVTVWQFGATDNAPRSRLFDYVSSAWVARDAARVVNLYFGALKNANAPFKRIPVS